ncbi:hypothetical protein ACJZ2D_001514 [Fusarium nematophilum]
MTTELARVPRDPAVDVPRGEDEDAQRGELRDQARDEDDLTLPDAVGVSGNGHQRADELTADASDVDQDVYLGQPTGAEE